MQLGIWTGCAGFHTNLSTLKAKGNTDPYSGPNSKNTNKKSEFRSPVFAVQYFLRMGESNLNFTRTQKSEAELGHHRPMNSLTP